MKKIVSAIIIVLFVGVIAVMIEKNSDYEESVIATASEFNYEQVKDACSENQISFEIVWTVFKMYPDIDKKLFINQLADYIDAHEDADVEVALIETLGYTKEEAKTIVVAANGAIY